MRYPNLRYGNPAQFAYYVATQHDGIKGIARQLRRSERSVRDWLNQKKKIPWWVPEILRLQAMERADIMRQHMQHVPGFRKTVRPLATVTHEGQLELRRPETKKPQVTDLRLDDFDQVKKTG